MSIVPLLSVWLSVCYTPVLCQKSYKHIIRDRPKPILLVSAVAETVAETEDMHSAVAEPGAESLVLVSAETVAETET